eukprot:9828886-Lingulodinium_polyedra.AAC.1
MFFPQKPRCAHRNPSAAIPARARLIFIRSKCTEPLQSIVVDGGRAYLAERDAQWAQASRRVDIVVICQQ